MRSGGSGKRKDPAVRQTRSGRKGEAKAAARSTRSAAKPKPRPVAQKRKPQPQQQQQTPQNQSPAAAKKQSATHAATSSRQPKGQQKKSNNTSIKESKAKEQRDNDREKIKEEDIKTEPVEVVIQVKKQRKTAKAETSKQGVASGKVGKRKNKQQCVKKEVLKKVTSKSDDNLERMNTIVEVALVKKVMPKPKVEEKPKTKERSVKKEKVEKKKNDKEVKKEPKQKEVKKDVKPDKKIKEEKMDETVIKEEKDDKEEKVVKCDKKNVEDKKKPVKAKNKAKKVEETIKNVSDSEKGTPTRPKVKLEKISPITVIDEEVGKPVMAEPENSPPVPEPPPVKKPPVKVTKKRQPIAKKKVVQPRKKVQVRPVKRQPQKEEEPPIIVKRHREASLNALAKVHCLYENESRGAMNEILDKSILKRKTNVKVEKSDSESQPEEVEEKPSRTLRTAPGMRGVGRHWDANIPSSSSSSFSSSSSSEEEETEKPKEEEVQEVAEPEEEEEQPPKEQPQKPEEKKVRKRRKRCEVRMDLKDMVVTKRMASLNASAMMAATYSLEKRNRGDDKKRSGRSSDDSSSSSVADDDSSDDDVILSGSSKKVAVIVNQDTDLTITGLYTTRSTHREGFCSIAGMQYRISSTSHTQTEATAVSTETVIHTTDHVSVSHSESGGSVDAGTSSPGGSCKSYTPLGALSSMQPPGQGRPCGPSAFSAPYHPHPQDIHGYYQPAGPLISHGGGGTAGSSKSATPEPPYPPPHPYPYATAYDYPGYYNRRYARPWPSTSQMMTEYMEPPSYTQPPHPNYYHPYPVPPTVPPPPPPPPPVCYTSPVRGLPYMEQPYQCPCPMQSSCPKNVHTGPLTGASKRSEATEAQTNNEVTPLLPVALALPPEPTGVSPGPPSPARGSAGMPPPASPALSTARNNRWSPPESGVIKVVTPPPPITIVETSPPPATSPPVIETPPPQTTTCKRRNKRVASDISHEVVVPVTKKRRKSSFISSKQQNIKNRVAVIKKEKDETLELKMNNNNNNYKKNADMQLRRNPSLKWSNGWSWEGDPFTTKVFLDTEDLGVLRKCYPAMRHKEGDLIQPRDCILLKSGPRKNLPFVAKISAMWENPEDGEMMVSVLWYYRPEHTEQGRLPDQPVDEIFASRHKDTNSVACIEDKCYVLTYHEYCRYRKSLLSNGRKCHTVVPAPSEGYPRSNQLPPGQVASDLVFFCRQVYDFRQKKILKKPPSQPLSSRT